MEVPLSKVSPDYLHSNSTSHTWAFSAAAELIDNAYDPDVAASELWIDWEMINGKQCLTFVDNGKGMDHTHLLHMLSFGYCEKAEHEALRTYKPIGKYGNGFKSGSMRLAKDALVFTVCRNTASVGFLSQSYLKAINSDCVRCYCSILFLVPRMKIYIRKVKVKNMPIAKSLSKTEEDTYRPSWLDKPLGITFGFVPSKTKNNIDDYGVMFYHRNRLIKTYEKIGYQKQASGHTRVDFLTPTHNKQDFVKDEKYK
nr:hypothetical protein BaRGS_032101 [Batillaria attramentaria]